MVEDWLRVEVFVQNRIKKLGENGQKLKKMMLVAGAKRPSAGT